MHDCEIDDKTESFKMNVINYPLSKIIIPDGMKRFSVVIISHYLGFD